MVVTEKRQERYVARAASSGSSVKRWFESEAAVSRSGHDVLGSELRVKRTDISFEDLEGDRVRIKVRVRNEGADRSPLTIMRLESAPLGAFVSWRPLDELLVMPLEPWETRELSTEVLRPRPTPLGSFDRVPPKSLLTALSAPDGPSRRPQFGSGIAGIMDLLRKAREGSDVAGKAALAPDAWGFFGREQPHWAGNINVFVGRGQPVERHMAKALRVYPGRTNLATFIVGQATGAWRTEAYGFRLAGSALDWNPVLYGVTGKSRLLMDGLNAPIEETKWVESEFGTMIVMLGMEPPENCGEGNLEVHVTKRSSGKTAIVEFTLDAKGKGPGCYTLG